MTARKIIESGDEDEDFSVKDVADFIVTPPDQAIEALRKWIGDNVQVDPRDVKGYNKARTAAMGWSEGSAEFALAVDDSTFYEWLEGGFGWDAVESFNRFIETLGYTYEPYSTSILTFYRKPSRAEQAEMDRSIAELEAKHQELLKQQGDQPLPEIDIRSLADDPNLFGPANENIMIRDPRRPRFVIGEIVSVEDGEARWEGVIEDVLPGGKLKVYNIDQRSSQEVPAGSVYFNGKKKHEG